MLSPTRFVARWGPSFPLRLRSRLRPAAVSLFLCAALLAAVVAPVPSRGQCRTAGSPGGEWTHTPGAVETDASSASLIPDLPSWPPSIDVSRNDVSWSYARGRALLSTVIPVAVGGTLLRLRPHDRTTNTLGLAVGGVGLLVGPSTGQWCLGGRYARNSALYTLARVGGAGGVALALDWGERTLEDARLIALPFVALSVATLIGLAGALLLDAVVWTIAETPRRACSAEGDGPVAVSPTVDAPTGGHGVRLAIQF